MKTLSELELIAGNYSIVKDDDGTYAIHRDGVSIHGVCDGDAVIAWMANCLFNYDYLLRKVQNETMG